jgi:hypothetical protein
MLSVTVEPSHGLVVPTSVAVTVNPAQAQLLLGEADRLKAKAQHLNDLLTSHDTRDTKGLLQTYLREANSDLDKTEDAYKNKGENNASSAKAVNAFFDDIRFEYGEAQRILDNETAQSHRIGPRLLPVGVIATADSPIGLGRGSEAVLKSTQHVISAFHLAASSAMMTFDLDVSSKPKGATVSYRQRTDPKFQELGDKTNCQIPNLYRAGYIILLHMAGYEDQPIEFNGAESTETSIHVDLVRKGRHR